jgi:hypothetical protein
VTDTPSSELSELLESARQAIEVRPLDITRVRSALEELLSFLASASGRTHANCVATDAFFSEQDEWSGSGDELPYAYAEIVWDIEGQLHDTVRTPSVALEFDSTPEQLLDRLRAIPDDSRGT